MRSLCLFSFCAFCVNVFSLCLVGCVSVFSFSLVSMRVVFWSFLTACILFLCFSLCVFFCVFSECSLCVFSPSAFFSMWSLMCVFSECCSYACFHCVVLWVNAFGATCTFSNTLRILCIGTHRLLSVYSVSSFLETYCSESWVFAG